MHFLIDTIRCHIVSTAYARDLQNWAWHIPAMVSSESRAYWGLNTPLLEFSQGAHKCLWAPGGTCSSYNSLQVL